MLNRISNTPSGRRSLFSPFGCHQSEIHFMRWGCGKRGDTILLPITDYKPVNLFCLFHSSTSFLQNSLCDQNQVCNKTTWPCSQFVLAIVNSHVLYFNILVDLHWKQLFLAFTFRSKQNSGVYMLRLYVTFVCYICMLHTRENMSKNFIIV